MQAPADVEQLAMLCKSAPSQCNSMCTCPCCEEPHLAKQVHDSGAGMLLMGINEEEGELLLPIQRQGAVILPLTGRLLCSLHLCIFICRPLGAWQVGSLL